MLRKSFTILSLLLLHYGGHAQNLVVNPSFEAIDNCPSTFGQISYPPLPPTWPQSVSGWYSNCLNSPDYYNGCSPDIYCTVPNNFHGYQPARTGQAYVGLVVYSGTDLNIANGYREYVHSKLSTPLVAGKKYNVSYYLNYHLNPDFPPYNNMMATNEMGAHFSASQLLQATAPLTVPYASMRATGNVYVKDTSGWVRVTGIYTAVGGEEWITIGSFGNGAPPPMIQAYPTTPMAGNPYHAYYLIDDVSVEEDITCDTVVTTQTITACALAPFNQSLTSPRAGADSYQWNTGGNTKDITVQNPGKYWVIAKDGCDYYTDTFNVLPIPQGPVLNHDTAVCIANGVTLQATTISAAAYLWNDGSTSSSIFITALGTYTCQIVKDCQLIKEVFKVTQLLSPAYVDVGDDVTLCKEAPGTIGMPVQGATAYLWSTGSNQYCITPPSSGSYWVQVWAGCKMYSDTIDVAFQGCENCIIFPNAFTPNADGLNDVFRPINRCPVKGYALRIFNRWGECIYTSFNQSEGWNGTYKGKKVETGVYHYFVEYQAGGNKGIEQRKGDISVVY